jgi:hypothetical protein
MHRSLERRRHRQQRIAAILTLLLMLAGGLGAYGTMAAIGAIEMPSPTARR